MIDDSGNLLFDNSEWAWVKERQTSPEAQDWYFLAYGKDYKKALKDFTAFAGKVPLPPRYAFGYWWSRYWSYSDNELRSLVDNLNERNIPLDVLVLDMDWHYTEPGKGGWTGYTWNRSLFPDPPKFLKYIKDKNLSITMNLHPASGVLPYEERYPQLTKAMGLDPQKGDTIKYEGSSKPFMTALMGEILNPLEKDGVDFWWLDWQQWRKDKKYKNLDNVFWLNYVFFSDMERKRQERPMLYHRWGGLGNHRYQIGFSGDTEITWNSLDFQPYFNSTASNVLYGYWSHDIGGHYRGVGEIQPEMYTRWMQFGAFSPVLRTHSTKNEKLRKEPWAFDNKYYNILKDIIDLRYAISPYVYTMARKTYEDGISLCRPMYYDYPDAEEAYAMKNEYMFGDNLLVRPVTQPMTDGYAEVDVWLPEGNDWYELYSGTLLKGGQTVKRAFAIDEIPVYVKAGSILPMTPGLKNLKGNDFAYELNVFPGGSGEFDIYEDNGNDKNYATEFATTHVSSRKEGNRLVINIAPRKGEYKDMPLARDFNIKVHGHGVPSSIKVNGQEIKGEYDGNELALNIALPNANSSAAREVVIEYPDQTIIADGTKGKFRKISQASEELKNEHAGVLFLEPLGRLESAGRNITYHPGEFARIIEQFNQDYSSLPEILNSHKMTDQERKNYLERIGWKYTANPVSEK